MSGVFVALVEACVTPFGWKQGVCPYERYTRGFGALSQ